MNFKNYAAAAIMGLSSLIGNAQKDEAPQLPLSDFVAQQQFVVPDSLEAHLYSIKDLDNVFMKEGDKDKSGNVAYLTNKLVDNSLGQNVDKYSALAAEIEIPTSLYQNKDNLPQGYTLEEVMNLSQEKNDPNNFFNYIRNNRVNGEQIQNIDVPHAFYYSVLGDMGVSITEDARGERLYNISRLLAEDLLENGTEIEKTTMDSTGRKPVEIRYLSKEDFKLENTDSEFDSIPENIFITDAATFYHQEDGKELNAYGQKFFRDYIVNNTPSKGADGELSGLAVVVYTSKATDNIKEVQYFPLATYAAVDKMDFGKMMDRMTDSQKTNLLRNSLEQAIEGSFVDKRGNIDCPEAYVLEDFAQKEKNSGKALNQGFYIGAGAYAEDGTAVPEFAVGYLTNTVGGELRVRYNPQSREKSNLETLSTEQVGQFQYKLDKLTEVEKERLVDLGLALPIKVNDRLYMGPYANASINNKLTRETRFGETQLNVDPNTPPSGPVQRVIEDATSESQIQYFLEDVGLQAIYGLSDNISLSGSVGYDGRLDTPVFGGRVNYHFNGGKK